jgi:hypothetical protein
VKFLYCFQQIWNQPRTLHFLIPILKFSIKTFWHIQHFLQTLKTNAPVRLTIDYTQSGNGAFLLIFHHDDKISTPLCGIQCKENSIKGSFIHSCLIVFIFYPLHFFIAIHWSPPAEPNYKCQVPLTIMLRVLLLLSSYTKNTKILHRKYNYQCIRILHQWIKVIKLYLLNIYLNLQLLIFPVFIANILRDFCDIEKLFCCKISV